MNALGKSPVAESFLHLSTKEQSEIFRGLAPALSRSPIVLEKDVWVCWVLKTLFTMPNRLPMAFKGGTSLSKVFGAIARFSEDVDITLDYRGLDDSLNPFAEGVSRNRLQKFSDDLRAFVLLHTQTVVLPHFQTQLNMEFAGGDHRLELSDDGEKLRLYYPTTLGLANDYIPESVLIEFGGRNITEPNEEHEIQPDIAPHLSELEFPNASVSVLSPTRTFWEKATLIHVECQRGNFRANADRLSRHWYDLAMLADLPLGETALHDRHLLADVVRHKKVFYNASYANYDACLAGQLRLVPAEAGLDQLRDDFQRMIGAGMFIGEAPDFDAVIKRLLDLEKTINMK
jgi:hypothetical protein